MIQRSYRKLVAAPALALMLLLTVVPAVALAAVAPSGDGFTWLAPPPSNIAVGAYEDDTTMFVFAEKTNFALPSAIDVNFTEPGTYDQDSDLPTTFPIFPKIPAGTVINSYYIHVDQTDAKGNVPFAATITFPEPIIGVILTDGRLEASRNVLGVPGITYPKLAAGGAFGYELDGACPDSPQDCATLSADRRTLTLEATVYDVADDMRVLTQAYGICALYDQTKSHQLGRTVPIKLQLCDASGNNLSGAGSIVSATGLTQKDGIASAVVDDAGSANSPDNNFRYDPALGGTGGYIYNLSTKELSKGTWELSFTVNGVANSSYTVRFDVK